MKTIILGASGATGKLVVMQLIKRQINIRILVRENASLPKEVLESPLVEIIRGNITEINKEKMSILLKDCEAIVSCLGHNISFKGIYGKPHYLVSSTIKKITEAIEENRKMKIILMSTTAYTNKKNGEINTIGEKIVFSVLKVLLPPHKDNVKAADFLIGNIGKENEQIEWIAVRPDTLINEEIVSKYEVFETLMRSPIFDSGETSRINVSHFMAELLIDEELWNKWKYKMPVIYNAK